MQAGRLLSTTLFLTSLASAADFFPLAPGNVWTYQNSRTGQTFSIQVSPPVVLNQRTYYPLTGYTPQPVLARLDERRELVMVDADTGIERPLTSFAVSPGGWWDAPARLCREEGQTFDRGTTFDGAAGPIRDVREVEYRVIGCADVGVQSEQFAENIGMVRRVEDSFAGPLTYDLIRARLGRLEINAKPHAQFSVSLDHSAQGRIALLRLLADASAPLTLQFSTAQEFDAEIRDEAGALLWRWSDGQLFAQAEHQLVVDRDWASPITLPALPAGNYSLQAWVTTVGRLPAYAATVPLAP